MNSFEWNFVRLQEDQRIPRFQNLIEVIAFKIDLYAQIRKHAYMTSH